MPLPPHQIGLELGFPHTSFGAIVSHFVVGVISDVEIHYRFLMSCLLSEIKKFKVKFVGNLL